jgi:hypothetical protein
LIALGVLVTMAVMVEKTLELMTGLLNMVVLQKKEAMVHIYKLMVIVILIINQLVLN